MFNNSSDILSVGVGSISPLNSWTSLGSEYLFPIIIFIAGIVVATIAKTILEDPIQRIFIWIFKINIFRKVRQLHGIWECTYRYPSKGVLKYESQVMRVSQYGSYIKARNPKGQSHFHKINGTIKNSIYLTGTWENITEGQIWHGAFQLVIKPSGTRMNGKWIGFDSEGNVEEGPWVWNLISRKNSRKEFLQITGNWVPDSGLVQQCSPLNEKMLPLIQLYGKAWTEQDSNLLSEVFTEDATYQERPFDKTFVGIGEIKEYWRKKVQTSQRNISFRLINLYSYGEIVIGEWEAEFDDLPKNMRKKIKEIAVMEIVDGKISRLREYWGVKKL